MPSAEDSRNPSIQPEQAELRAFHDYWVALPSRNGLPSRSHIDPAAICSLLKWLFMIDVEQQPPDPRYRYRLAGTEVVRLYGLELTGMTVEEAFPAQAEELIAGYSNVVACRTPMLCRYRLPVLGHHYRFVEQLTCPLSEDGRTVNMLVGVVAPCSWKASKALHQSAA